MAKSSSKKAGGLKKRQRAQYISKGERRSVKRSTTKALRREYQADGGTVMLNKLKAQDKGKNVKIPEVKLTGRRRGQGA